MNRVAWFSEMKHEVLPCINIVMKKTGMVVPGCSPSSWESVVGVE